MNACLTFVHALSPLHAGTGQGVGVIDLPIAREKATNLPYLPGSTLKGTLRDECEAHSKWNVQCEDIFGPKTIADDAGAYAGSAVFSDQRLLCLPVRSLLGTFAWVTSPYILERFKRDASNIGLPNLPQTPTLTATNLCLVSGTKLIYTNGNQQQVVLEDLDLELRSAANANAWAAWLKGRIFPQDATWQSAFTERLCIVHDDVFNFLAETATEVIARNRLDDNTKTVVRGALWYEEALPAETILAGLLAAVKVKIKDGKDIFKAVKDLTEKPLQLGGKATVGRGLCTVRVDA